VRVWTRRLDVADDELGEAEATLSPDERDRARRFHFEKDRRRFISARAMLRSIVGERIGVAPADVAFRYGSRGKPELQHTTRAVRFNLSHSEDLCVIAVHDDREVGVDVERIRPLVDLDAVRKRFFSVRERAAIVGGDPAGLEAFFYFWTLKEAWLKGSGEGIGDLLTAVEVRHDGDGRPSIARVDDPPGGRMPWAIKSWSPAAGFIAALAVRSD